MITNKPTWWDTAVNSLVSRYSGIYPLHRDDIRQEVWLLYMDVQASMEEYAPALAIRIIRNGLVDWLRSRKFNYSVRGVVEHISWDAYLKAWNEYTESFWNNEYGSSIPQFPSFEDEVIERLDMRERIQNAGLTKRERNIMGLRLLGYSNEEIAIKRKCSSSNVRHALLDIRRKMGGEKE